ncbi:glycerol-3-phosphate dehydrogenase [Rhodococcus sp. 15-649-1-2]|nr:glycerol-3-phosphate dehydrogenase/oxidase [Rhodococcus sp. 15-649-1-2]OZE76826.1 glycerol-3-phosphate dehydrogenase [Rhodococcus sp. 15-649-1-2]
MRPSGSSAPSSSSAPSGSSALNGARRERDLEKLWDGDVVDVLVVGGGVTGAGVALDAASRGLSVALVEKHDLAFGTSRWSSKLVHGGLRYLASGHVGIAHESAVERGILMTRTAPHLVRRLPTIIPLHESVSRVDAVVIRAGQAAGDALRAAAGTPAALLPRADLIGAGSVVDAAPTVRRRGLRGGARSWDGQLVDDARLVVAVARTAASYGASVLTGLGASDVDRTSARITDTESGESTRIRARIVVNSAGVWAGEIDSRITLRPSRGTHLVFDDSTFGGLNCSLTIPIPGERNRFVFALPAPLGRVYVGLTDEATSGPVPDVPVASDTEVDFLLAVLGTVVDPAPTRADIIGSFAGLRPLLASGDGASADLSRRHAVLDDGAGPVGVVGGKLTTYRLMAEQAVDVVATALGETLGPSRTASIPLVGAATQQTLDAIDAPVSVVRRFGADAMLVRALADRMPGGWAPVAEGIDICEAELAFSVQYEGARSVGDLLDRRTRIGLVDVDRERAVDSAERALEQFLHTRR